MEHTLRQTYRILCCTCTIQFDDVLMANARQLLYLLTRAPVNNIFIIWLCLTRTGNYLIDEFDWLKWILTAF